MKTYQTTMEIPIIVKQLASASSTAGEYWVAYIKGEAYAEEIGNSASEAERELAKRLGGCVPSLGISPTRG